MGALVNKWQKVQDEQTAEQEARDAEEARQQTAEFKEGTKQREIARFLKRQVESGQAAHNPNFVPVSSDWRKRVASRKQARDDSI